MDFWNRKKVNRLMEEINLKTELYNSMKRRCDDRDKKIAKLEKRLRGERVCDDYCKECEHAIIEDDGVLYSATCGSYYRVGRRISCVLDCKCKDFKKR